MTSKKEGEVSNQGQTESLSYQSGVDRAKWEPKRLGYGGRQWSRRPTTELENDLYRESYRKQQPFGPTMIDLGREDKIPSEYLTENGLKLLKVLALGDKEIRVLSLYAEDDGFDLKTALDELRKYKLLDESESEMIALVKKKL